MKRVHGSGGGVTMGHHLQSNHDQCERQVLPYTFDDNVEDSIDTEDSLGISIRI